MAAGDERALGELYDRHGSAVYALARAIVGERADTEEVVADAFGQAWRTAGKFDPARGSVTAWLATITRTRALDLVRARGRRSKVLARAAQESDAGFATPLASSDAPDRDVERQETRQLVTRSLGQLPEAQRRVIELAYFGGLSHSEIAAELNARVRRPARRARPATLPWAAAAAVVLAILGGFGYWRAREEARVLRTRLDVAQRQRDSTEHVVAALLDSSVAITDLAATGKAPSMRLYWNRARHIVVVAAFDLPPAPAGRTYQLWAIEKGRAPVSVGTFNSPSSGRTVITLQMPAGVQPEVSAVTEEPAGGSPQPTQQPFLIGSLPRRS